MPKPLVVGLDIGTTSAISIHDLDRNLLFLKSRRHISTSGIIKQITFFGTPVLIATDKQNVPGKIRKIAAAFGAKIHAPDHDLLVEEKDKIVNVSMADSHERDALASALFAFRSYSAQFSTIDASLEAAGLRKHSDRVKELVIKREAKNIAEAIDMVRPRQAEPTPVAPVREISIDQNQRADSLESRLRDEKQRYDILKCYADKLENKVRSLEAQKHVYLDEQMRRNDDARKAILKDKEIRSRDIVIRQLRFEIQKERSIRRAYEQKARLDSELKGISSSGLIPVIMISSFTKEEILDAHRKFDISDKAVWIRGFNPSKVAAKVLVSVKPRIVLGEMDIEAKDILDRGGIIAIESVKPEVKGCYAAVSPQALEGEMKKMEKKAFLRWLEDYKARGV